MLLGMLVLGERLNVVQGAAVVLAGLGGLGMTLRAGELPWISLALAGSFALYDLIHKLSPRPPLAVVVYGEALTRAHALAFGCIWTALALFSFDSFQHTRVVASVLVTTRNFSRGLPPEQGNPG